MKNRATRAAESPEDLRVAAVAAIAARSAAGSAWPAPIQASPWERFELETMPRASTSTRPPVRSSRSPAMRDPGPIDGIALRFETWFAPHVDGKCTGTRCYIHSGALDRSLRRIAAGRLEIPLNFDHHGETLTTSDGGFELFISGRKLRLRIRDRFARRVIALGDWRELSMGLVRCEAIQTNAAAGPLLSVTAAEIDEIALVHRGACAGCRLSL